MEGIQDKIAQVKVLLEDIKSQLGPWLINTRKADKQLQLEAVSKLTEKFDKMDTNLPSEIRELKFKLIQEIDKFKEAEQLSQELANTLAPFVNQKTVKKIKSISLIKNTATSPKQYGIKVYDLIEYNIIEPNTKIYKRVNNEEYEALITSNGTIKLTLNNKTTVHNSLSLAAKEIMGRPINGWTWWEIKESAGNKTLDHYRQKLLRNGK